MQILSILACLALGAASAVANVHQAGQFQQGKLLSNLNLGEFENQKVLGNEEMQFGSYGDKELFNKEQFETAPVMAPKWSGFFSHVRAPIELTQPIYNGVIELAPIMSTYTVPRESWSQENIKQPITQPVLQPYLQRYVKQAQPIVQPWVNRVVQPVVHRQLQPFLETKLEQGLNLHTITKPTQFTHSTNQPIVGADLPVKPMTAKVLGAKPKSRFSYTNKFTGY